MSGRAFLPADPDITFARQCVVNTLTDIAERPGAVFDIAEDQAYLADLIRNKPRVKRGLPPIVARWDRDAPGNVVTITERAA